MKINIGLFFLTIKKWTVLLAIHKPKRKYVFFKSSETYYNINTINAFSSSTFPNVAHRMKLDCICNVVSPMLLNQTKLFLMDQFIIVKNVVQSRALNLGSKCCFDNHLTSMKIYLKLCVHSCPDRRGSNRSLTHI